MILRPTHSRVIMPAAITGRDSTARYSAMRGPTAAWRAMAQGGPHQEAMAISLSDLDCSHFRSSLITGHSQCPAACLKGANKRLMHCSKKLPIRPRSLSTSAIEARLVVPATWIARITGSTVWANSFAALIWIARPRGPARLRL